MNKSIKTDINRWWGNLENGIQTAIEDTLISDCKNLTKESTIAELLELCKDKIEEFKDDD